MSGVSGWFHDFCFQHHPARRVLDIPEAWLLANSSYRSWWGGLAWLFAPDWCLSHPVVATAGYEMMAPATKARVRSFDLQRETSLLWSDKLSCWPSMQLHYTYVTMYGDIMRHVCIYITLHYTTLHYITCIHTYTVTYIYMHIHIPCIYIHIPCVYMYIRSTYAHVQCFKCEEVVSWRKKVHRRAFWIISIGVICFCYKSIGAYWSGRAISRVWSQSGTAELRSSGNFQACEYAEFCRDRPHAESDWWKNLIQEAQMTQMSSIIRRWHSVDPCMLGPPVSTLSWPA